MSIEKHLDRKKNKLLQRVLRFLRGELLVNDVDPESISHPLHPGDQICQVLDGLHLVLEEGPLQEVGQLTVVVLAGSSMNLKKRLKKGNIKVFNYRTSRLMWSLLCYHSVNLVNLFKIVLLPNSQQ